MGEQFQLWVRYVGEAARCWELHDFYPPNTDWSKVLGKLKAGLRTPCDYRIVRVVVVGAMDPEG